MRVCLLIAILLSPFYNSAQNIDSIFKECKVKNIDQLVVLINKYCINDSLKARGIYCWITNNIQYDLGQLKKKEPKKVTYTDKDDLKKKLEKYRIKQAKKTFKKRKGICEDYSALFDHICKLVNIKSEIIIGFAKTKVSEIGLDLKNSNHAWNAVSINNQWKLIDATWGAGYIDYESKTWKKEYSSFYFFTNPNKLSFSHYPKDQTFLLLNYPYSIKDFFAKPLYYTSFFEQNFTIIQPENGLITIQKGDTITFRFQNSKQNIKMSYTLGFDKYSRIIDSINNDVFEVKLSFKTPMITSITFFSENMSILSYKLKIE